MEKSNYRITLFCIVTSLFWFSMYAFVPNLPTYAETLGSSHRLIGLILGSYGFVQMLARIPLGIYSDRIGKRKIFIILGIVISSLSALGMAIFPNPKALLIFRGMTGLAAASWVTFTVLFSSYFNAEDASKSLGYLNAFNALGQMLAMLLGGIVAKSFGLRAPFFLSVTIGLLGIVLSFGIKEKIQSQSPLKISSLLAIGKEKNVLISSGLAVLIQIITFATVYGFTPVAAARLGADEFQRGLLTTLSTIPTIFASALSGSVFAKKAGAKRTIILSFVLFSISCALIPIIKDLRVLYFTEVIGGFARGLVFPILMGISIGSVDVKMRGTAMGFFQSIYGLGMFLGPVLVGIISDMASLSWGFWIISLLGIIGSIISKIIVEDTF
ncbi:MAG: MFS transporter [Clostridiales bacterium]|nr:MFS transporter [Clostridiales bacterium]